MADKIPTSFTTMPTRKRPRTNTKQRLAFFVSLVFLLTILAALPLTAVAVNARISNQPVNRSISAGGNTTFNSGGSTGNSFQWQVATSGSNWSSVSNGDVYSGATTTTLTLTNVPASYNGYKYRLAANGDNGIVYSNEVTLTVTGGADPSPSPSPAAGPVITSHPSNRSVSAGQNATFSVTATGSAPLTYQWQIGVSLGSIVSAWTDLPGTTFAFPGNTSISVVYSGEKTATLTVNAVAAEISGVQFRCVVSNSSGTKVNSNAATLTVTGGSGGGTAPVITNHPASQTVAPGAPVTFSVTATGSAPLAYQWQYSVNSGASWDNVTSGTGTTATLSYASVDAGWAAFRFRCVVSNSSGTATSNTATLTVTSGGGTAPVITSSPQDQVTAPDGTAVFSVTATGAASYQWQYTADMGASWQDFTNNQYFSGATAATFTFTGVGPAWDGRQIRCVVKNSSGTAAYSNAATLTVTSGAAPTPAPGSTPGSTPTPTPGSTTGNMSNFKPTNSYTPGQFTDVSEDAWYGNNQQKVVALAYQYGLMMGKTKTEYTPSGNVTIAEALTIAVRVHSIYTTGTANFTQGSPWYQVYVDYAITNGIIAANDFPNYTRNVTRSEMAYLFVNALPESEFTSRNTVNSLPDVNNATANIDAILLLYRAGVLTGSDTQGTFNPYNNINRAETAAIITRVILPSMRVSGRTFG